ncbi:uncharacterized protein N7483_012469 [Penicillium malachiteum]|uniref:uncharacterized protein n=1 Tax=Penicillium malachiteum TaxID=1324776 RepID=UPI002549BE91|nr:uncharacterized protein N7483_012469 [Penicillium malachiteum]KAJ5715288.1 hypothetical protein N7483_012469 [Penicillium malachiteum]
MTSSHLIRMMYRTVSLAAPPLPSTIPTPPLPLPLLPPRYGSARASEVLSLPSLFVLWLSDGPATTGGGDDHEKDDDREKKEEEVHTVVSSNVAGLSQESDLSNKGKAPQRSQSLAPTPQPVNIKFVIVPRGYRLPAMTARPAESQATVDALIATLRDKK